MKVTNSDGSDYFYGYGSDGRYLSAKTYDVNGQLKFTDQFNHDAQGNRLGVRQTAT